MQRKESSKSVMHHAKLHEKSKSKKSIYHITQSPKSSPKDETKKQRRRSKIFKESDCDYDSLCLSYESFNENSQNKYQNEKSILFF